MAGNDSKVNRVRTLKVPAAMVSIAVLLMVAAIWIVGNVEKNVDSATGNGASGEEYPTGVQRQIWEWNADSVSRVKAVWSTDAGVVVSVDGKGEHGDGVIGINTTSGDEEWHYRVRGSEVRVNVLPGRDRVVLSYLDRFWPIFPGQGYRKTVVVDSASGEVLSSRESSTTRSVDESEQDTTINKFTSSTRVQIEAGGGYLERSIKSFDLRSGKLLWNEEAGDRCAPAAGTSMIGDFVATSENYVLVSYSCLGDDENGRESEVLVKALDARTGEDVWEYKQSAEDLPSGSVTGHPSRLIRMINDSAGAWTEYERSSVSEEPEVGEDLVYMVGPEGGYVVDVESGDVVVGGMEFGDEGGVELYRAGERGGIIGLVQASESVRDVMMIGVEGEREGRLEVSGEIERLLPLAKKLIVSQGGRPSSLAVFDLGDGTEKSLSSRAEIDPRVAMLAPGAIVVGTFNGGEVAGLVGFA